MVFLYGGAFFFGSTNYRFYNGAILAALTDVIIVTVNYRLGPFGFMNARIPEIPGNQGLWDQHLAFRCDTFTTQFAKASYYSIGLIIEIESVFVSNHDLNNKQCVFMF